MANKTEKPAEAQTTPDKKLKNVRYRQTLPTMPTRPKDTEAQTRKIVVIGSLVTLTLVVLLVAAALLQMFVFEPNRAVASVGGQNITVSQLQKQMKLSANSLYNQYSNMANAVAQFQQQSQNDETSGFLLQLYQQQLQQVSAQITNDGIASGSLDNLINDQLIHQEAKKRGISATADEVTAELQKDFGYYTVPLTPYPTYTPQPVVANATPMPTTAPQVQPTSVSQADYQTKLDSAVKYFDGVGLGEAGLRATYETRLLSQKLQDAMGKDVPDTAQHYLLDYITFNAEADAKSALDKLGKGAIFSDVISATNAITQPAGIGNGASLDWISKFEVASQFGEDVVSKLDAAALNKPTDIITSSLGGFNIFLVKGRESRKLSDSELQTQRQKPYTDWLTKAQSDPAIVNRIETPTKFLPADVKSFITNFQAQAQTQ